MITKTTRKTYSPAFKAKVVEEYLLGEHLLSEIAATNQVHPNLILKWKKAAIAALVLATTVIRCIIELKYKHS